MMKPQNQKPVVLADMMSHKCLLHGEEGMKAGQLGTTIYDDDQQDQGKTPAKNASSVQISLILNKTYRVT